MVAITLYLAIAAIALTVAYLHFFYRRARKGEPGLVPGNLIFGNGIAFGKNAVEFVQSATKTVGKIFSIRLIHQYMYIINDPHTYERFVKEKNFDFEPIQKQVNLNCFKFRLFDYKNMIKAAGKKVKGKNMAANMLSFSKHLKESFVECTNTSASKCSSDEGWCEDSLRSMACTTMFRAIFRTIFGKEDRSDPFEPMKVYTNFESFHKYWNYLWLGLPWKLFPNACKAFDFLVQMPASEDIVARSDVSEYIKYSTQFMKNSGQTESDIIGHNLVFLHVNYNTFKVSFWLIYMLTQYTEAHEALVQEIEDFVEHKTECSDADAAVEIAIEDIDRLPVLDSIVKETIRYCSGVFMIRFITEDTAFEMEDGKVYNLRAGDRVAIYPPAIHKDPEIFENPLEYKYDRFIDAKFYKDGREVKTPLLAFGSLCPGKKLAMTQAKWYLFNLAHQFDFKVANGETCQPDVKYHGHEILPPTNDVKLMYRHKQNVRDLELAQ